MFFQKQKPKTIGYLRRQISLSLVLVFSVLLLSGLFSYTRGGAPEQAVAATSSNLNIQARLYSTSGNVVPDGYYNVEFKMYDAVTSGSLLWTESWYDSNGVTAGNDNRIRVVNGYMSVQLGTHTALPSVNWDDNIYISLNIGGTTQTATPTYDGEMSPRIKLNSVPFAQAARNVQSGNTSAASTNSGNISIQTGNATGATSNSGNVTLDVGTATGTAGTISVGTANTSGITIGRVGVITAIDGQLTISGTQFTNNGSTVNGVQSLGDFPTGGSIGSAASTVDVDTAFSIVQTTAGQTISLPSPTVTTAGRIVYILNTGSASFTMEGVSIAAGYGQIYIWNGSSWRLGATGGSGTIALQAAYDGGNTIVTSDARNIDVTLANTATDANFLVNIATGSTGEFKIQNNGTDVLQIGSAGQLQLDTQGATGGILLGGDTNIYRSAANTLKTDDDFAVGNNLTITASSGNLSTSGNISTTGTGTITSADDLAVNGDSITTDDTTFNLLNTTATTINAFGAATAINIGANNAALLTGGNFNINTPNSSSLYLQSSGTDKTIVIGNVNGSSATVINSGSGGIQLTGQTDINGVLIDANGSVVIQVGDTFNMNGDALTDLTGSGLTVSSGALTVDDTSATGFFRNGGNSFSGAATLGTNDANVLNFETGGTNRFQVSSSGSVLTGQGNSTITATGELTLNATATNNLNIGTNTTSGTISVGDSSGSSALFLYAGTSGINLYSGAAIDLYSVGATSIGANGDISIANTANINIQTNDTYVVSQNNSTAAFQVQNSSSGVLLNVNATSGLVTVGDDLAVNGNDLTTDDTTFNLLNTTATTINAFGAATAINIGAAAGSTITGNGELTFKSGGTNTDFNIETNGSGSIYIGNNNTGSGNIVWIGNTDTAYQDFYLGASNSSGSSQITVGNVGTVTLRSSGVSQNTSANAVRIIAVNNDSDTLNVRNSSNSAVFQVGTDGSGVVIADDLAINGGDITSSATTFNLLQSNVTTLNIGSAVGAGGINLAGGSGSTGCTIDGSNGNLTCSGAITSTATSGTQGWWSRSGTTLQPANSGDNITTTGNISTTGTGTITSAGLLTASDDLAVNGDAITTDDTTFNLLNTTATTINAFGAASTINLGAAGATVTNPGSLNIRATGTNTLDLDTTGAGTIGLGDTNATTIGIGNTTAATAVTIQGGTSATAVNIQAAASGNINIGTNAVTGKVLNIGSVGSTNNNTTVNIANSSAAIQTVSIGSTSSSSATTIQGGTGGINLSPSGSSNTGLIVRPTVSNSTAAFQIQNQAGTSTLLNADTTNMRVSVGTIGTATGQLYVSGRLPTTHLGTIASSGANSVYIQGKYAYVTNPTSDLLQIFDVSNPASPVLTGSVSTGSGPRKVYVQGRYAYVIDSSDHNLKIFDVSNPASPSNVSTISTSTNPFDIQVQGRYVYISLFSSNPNMQVFDVGNPSQPVLVSSAGTANVAFSIHVQGRYAYVTFLGDEYLRIFDISNPASPSVVGSVATLGANPQSVYVQGKYAYVRTDDTTDYLQIFDISNPASPTSVGSLVTPTGSGEVFVQGRYAYLSMAGSSFHVVDISNPASPTSLGGLSSGNSGELYVQGRYLYMVEGNNLRIYDLGGAYTQQLEAGGIETSTLSVLNNASIEGSVSVQGGLTVLDSSNFSGGLSVGSIFDVTGSAAFRKGTDFSTTGSSNNVNFGEVSLVRLTGASAQTITGIANGRDGEILTIVNAAGQSATISNNSGSSSAGNQIITGTGANITLAAGGSITLVYDSTAGFWRVTGSVAFSTGNFIQNGTSQQTSANFNIKSASAGSVGAVIQGTTAQTADIFQLKDENNLNLLAVGANAGYAIQSSDGFTSTNAFTVGVVNSGVPTTIFGVNSTSPGVYTGSTTFSVFNTTATTINAFGAASTINLGAAGATVTNPGSLNIRATGTNTLDLDTTGAGTIGLGDTNATTIGIGNTTAATQTTIQGGTGTSAVNIQAGSAGDINIGTVNNNDLNINTAAVAGTTILGGTSTTGTITLGRSTATNIVSIGTATSAMAASATQTVNIGNGTLSNASSSIVVNILSGTAGSNGTASLLMGNNDRVTQIDIGNVAADAARTLNFGTGNNTVGIDTLNIGTGNTTVAGGKTINIGTGTPTGSGTNVVTIGSLANASTTTIQGGTGAGGITLTAAGSASTGVMVKNSTNSTAAFQIQNASSQSLFVADTTNQRIAVGPAAVPANGILTVGTNTTANTGGIFFGTDTNLYRYGAGQLASDGSIISTSGNFYTTGAGTGLLFGNTNTSGIINALANGAGDMYFYNGSANPVFTLTQTGTALFRNSTNSTVAFQIQSATGSDTMFIADTTTANKIKIGNSTGTGTSTTVFQLDAAASAPFGTGQTAYLGSMYYDSTQGKLQCYENRNGTAAWGACGSAPNNIITLTPEYTGAVLNGTGVGTLTADFCSNESAVLVVGTLCANHEARNFYKWTSPQGTDQTYSIFVTHKLPSTFSSFSDANTMKLTALTDNTTNANATLQVFRKNVLGNTIVSCGSATTINNTANTWQQTSFGGDETACGFTGGDYVIFRINVTAKSGGNVYVENLDFTYTNQ